MGIGPDVRRVIHWGRPVRSDVLPGGGARRSRWGARRVSFSEGIRLRGASTTLPCAATWRPGHAGAACCSSTSAKRTCAAPGATGAGWGIVYSAPCEHHVLRTTSPEGFMPRSIAAFLLAPLLLLACGDPDSPSVTRLSTDAPEYTLARTSSVYQGNVTLSFTNANTFAVTIPGCGGLWPVSLERRRPIDGGWEFAAWLGPYTKCLEETTVRTDATVNKVVMLTFPDASFAGEYRVGLGVWTAPNGVSWNSSHPTRSPCWRVPRRAGAWGRVLDE
jgi:hypothetical protein